MNSKKICVLAGDGIGREVTNWGVKALEAVGGYFNIGFTFENALLGHAAIEATGNPIPDATLEACNRADAILLGAVGDPIYDNNPSLKVRPEQGLLKLRKSLGLYANLRPIIIFDELLAASSIKPEILKGADILFFRELTGGIYFGEPRGRRENDTVAFDSMVYAKYEVKRIAKMAFDSAMTRKKVLHSVDKANVLESSRLWREVIQEMSKDYPEVTVIHMFVDNAAMQLIKNPRQFDVVVTGNMFGDILTDAASQISGSLGMLPSASVGDQIGLFEPIHGSAPDIAGQNLANPLAAILSISLMLDSSFNEKEASQVIIAAVDQVLKSGFRTRDIADSETAADHIIGTDGMGEKVLAAIHSIAKKAVPA